MKLLTKLSNDQYDAMRHLLGHRWVPNPLWPGHEKPGHADYQRQGWHPKKAHLDTGVKYAQLPCAKDVMVWAKEGGIERFLEVDKDGGGAFFNFASLLNDEMSKLPAQHYVNLREMGQATNINIGCDAFNMYAGRPFTNLVFRLSQQAVLAGSYKASVVFALYEGKDDD